MEEEYEKLLYISKSKKGLFDSCPRAFKFNYIDKLDRGYNLFLDIGINVHEFADKFFDTVKTGSDDKLHNLTGLDFKENTEYKKNVAKFEIERWSKISIAGFDKMFFYPIMKEEKFTLELPQLVGIVDAVFKCCTADPFAPKHPEFKDGDTVIVENKTGKPTAEKCTGYKEDMLWYKIIIEISHPELVPIRWGAIYFPYNNYVYHCELKAEDCKELMKRIDAVRERIRECIETDEWEATPSKKTCNWCNFKDICLKF